MVKCCWSNLRMRVFDINGMLTKLMQYANMADALSHIERTVEYIVQIPIKHREAFEAGEGLYQPELKNWCYVANFV